MNIENHLPSEIEYKNCKKIGYININQKINYILIPKIADNSKANNNKLDYYETNEKSEDVHKIITKSVSKRIIKKSKFNYEKSNNLNDLPEVNYLSHNLPKEIILLPQSKNTMNNIPFKIPEDLSIDKNQEFVNPIIPELKSISVEVSNLRKGNGKKTDATSLKMSNSKNLNSYLITDHTKILIVFLSLTLF